MTQLLAPTQAVSSPMAADGFLRVLDGFGHWLAVTLNHAFGNPREEAAHQPPLVGVQPYRDRPCRRRSRLL
jgi:hypothetical protein